MVQQLSEAELEVMKIVWGSPEEVTLFPYIMDGLAARDRPCQKRSTRRRSAGGHFPSMHRTAK